MRLTWQGSPPAWLTGLTDELLLARFGPATMQRGRSYQQQGAVRQVEIGGDGLLLLASVRGSARASYQTLVTGGPAGGGASAVGGRCSCPVQADCKHVVAVLLTVRSALRIQAAQPRTAPALAWEAALTPLIPRNDSGSAPAELALQVSVVSPRPNRYAPDPARRLRLRAVTRGRQGRWIVTGVGWRELERGHTRPAVRPAHRTLVRRLLGMHGAAQQSGYGYSYGEPVVHLDELGPEVWQVLVEAERAGLPLVAGKGFDEVWLMSDPVAVGLDLRATDTGAQLSVRLDWPDSAPSGVRDVNDYGEDEVLLVGDPAHGCALEQGRRLVLARLEPMLDAAARDRWRDGPVLIPAAELAKFLAVYYPALDRRLTVGSADGSVELPSVVPPRLALRVTFEPDHVARLGWQVVYQVGDEQVRVPVAGAGDPGAPPDPVRDRRAEQALIDSLVELDRLEHLRAEIAGRWVLAGEALLSGMRTARFVDEVLPALQARDDVLVEVVGEPARYAEAVEPPAIAVSATDDPAHPDWFDLGVSVSVAGEQVPLAALLTALTHGEPHLILDSGTWFRLDRPELDTLRRLLAEARALQDRPGAGLRVTALQAGLWEELVELGVVAEQSDRWSRTAGALLGLDQIPRPDPPAGLLADLRPYQVEGYQWLSLLWDLRLGGVLADDMGLGKTVQTLAMAVRAVERGELGGEAGPVLIVAPTSVVGTWAAEAARFCPQLRVVAVTETQHKSGRKVADQVDGAHLVVTSYTLLRLDEEAYRGLPWSGLVLDEAQFVKNHQAKTYQCARRLPAPFKLAITGTPLENSLMDLWSMLSITSPGLFPNPARFTETYRRPIESGQAPEQLDRLRRRIRPLMLRRSKQQVAVDLPPKIEQVLPVVLNPAHRRLYDTHLQRERQRVLRLIDDVDRNRIAILRSLTVLRQLSLDASLVDDKHAGRIRSSKIDALVEQLADVVSEGHRALVFSQFTGFLRLVRDRLAVEGIGHCYLDGRTRDRPRRIAEFRDGTDPVFLISLKAGGFGLTLTEADYVFVLDPWWNPATEAQAVDRTHRIGQDKTVMVYRLVATDTIEEKVVALQERKRELFRQVVDGGSLAGGAITADDIRGLFDADH